MLILITRESIKIIPSKNKINWALVAHTNHLRYSGGRDQEAGIKDNNLKPAPDPFSQKPITKKG
jgi:hypothetical protein